ncbi:MAG: substrate-binding domain-containing protein [Clostridia bacterium]|nr:substrate-binding domain-containing protein [Clostridia bacterium]
MKRILFLLLMPLFLCNCADIEPTAQNIYIDTANDISFNINEGQIPLTIEGASLAESSSRAVIEEFIRMHPEYQVEYRHEGNTQSIKDLHEGLCQMAALSRELKADESKSGINKITYGYYSLAIITHPDIGIDNLTLSQLKDIYTGNITNWSEVGGPDKEIVVTHREDGSAARAQFLSMLGYDETAYFDSLDDTFLSRLIVPEGGGRIEAFVNSTPYSIGYAPFPYINDTFLTSIPIDGNLPNEYTVCNGNYPLASQIYYIFSENETNSAVKKYIDFLETAAAKKAIYNAGLIPAYSDEELSSMYSLKSELPIEERRLYISYSSYIEWMTNACYEGFSDKNYYYDIITSNKELKSSLQSVIDGTSHIALLNRNLTSEEKASGLSEILLGYYPMGIIINGNNPVDNLSFSQIKDIFTGKITNWAEVGGDNSPIQVINTTGYSDRSNFYFILGFDNPPTDEYILNNYSSDSVFEQPRFINWAIRNYENSIAYIPINEIENSTKIISVNGYLPEYDNISQGNYVVSIPFYYIYNKDKINQAAKDYIGYLMTADGKAAIEYYGIISSK